MLKIFIFVFVLLGNDGLSPAGALHNCLQTGPPNSSSCVCCKSTFRGSQCQEQRPDCMTIIIRGVCNYYCRSDYYGDLCDKACPEQCRHNNKLNQGSCVKDSQYQHVRCISGCKTGFYGFDCSNNCSNTCLNGVCRLSDGWCVRCIPNMYGTDCDRQCSEGCKTSSCYRNGTCTDGCKDGFSYYTCIPRVHYGERYRNFRVAIFYAVVIIGIIVMFMCGGCNDLIEGYTRYRTRTRSRIRNGRGQH